jgi:hypothetical protein
MINRKLEMKILKANTLAVQYLLTDIVLIQITKVFKV